MPSDGCGKYHGFMYSAIGVITTSKRDYQTLIQIHTLHVNTGCVANLLIQSICKNYH